MTAPKLSDYVHTRDGLAALVVYRTTDQKEKEIFTIVKPEDWEEIDHTWTLRDYLFYVQAHPTTIEAQSAVRLLGEVADLTD